MKALVEPTKKPGSVQARTPGEKFPVMNVLGGWPENVENEARRIGLIALVVSEETVRDGKPIGKPWRGVFVHRKTGKLYGCRRGSRPKEISLVTALRLESYCLTQSDAGFGGEDLGKLLERAADQLAAAK